MDLIKIEGSSRIKAYGWEPRRMGAGLSRRARALEATGILQLEFQQGVRWYFFDVPAHVFEGFLLADSRGKYFHAHIKGRYNEQSADDVERRQTIS